MGAEKFFDAPAAVPLGITSMIVPEAAEALSYTVMAAVAVTTATV
jgi:hypothetical protein